MPGHVHLDRRVVDREAVRSSSGVTLGRAGSDGAAAAAAARRAAPPAAERREDPLRAGRQVGDPDPVASAIAATTAGAPTSIGSSPTPFAPCGRAPNGASTRIVVIRGASSEVGMM